MCPCSGYHVCGYHAAEIERLYRELRDLEVRWQDLSIDEQERLRQVRGELHRYGLKADIVIRQVETREWEEANA